ncbi:MAG TPA: hypothetical protein VH371_08105 [Candidatus Limnocylindrales bacterium]|jgi:hypothetical protein
METAQIVALRVAPPPPQRLPVSVEDEVIVVDHLRLSDRSLAAFVEQRAPADRAELIERALRIGLHALQDAGTSIDVEMVRREFEALLKQNVTANERAAHELDQVLRSNFADQDGRLPRTLERFLGDRGQLNKFISDLFDESKRDSAIGRMRQLLGTYFDGDASRLAQLLDPTRLGSPLHQFRNEMALGFEKLNERLAALEAAQVARAAERAKSAAKGADFEDLLEQMLAETARGAGDLIERTGALSGDVLRSKKGDFLLTIDPQWCHGADLRVVIEAKNRRLSWREIREELDAAKRNRGAAMAVAVFSPEHAPAGIEPFDVRYGHVFCVVDPANADEAILAAAIKLARLYAVATLAEREDSIDPARVIVAVAAIKTELEALRGLKTQLTSVSKVAGEVNSGLDRLRDAILARVADAEAQLRAGVGAG